MNAVTHLNSPLGSVTIESSANGVVSVRFGPNPGGGGDASTDAEQVGKTAARELLAYLNGKLRRFSVPVDLSWTTPFLKDVYSALMTVPYGCTTSYAALAASAGRFDAARAVGGAMAKNRVLIIVPCHRVISASGRIGGWSGPSGLKERLHAIEGIGPLC